MFELSFVGVSNTQSFGRRRDAFFEGRKMFEEADLEPIVVSRKTNTTYVLVPTPNALRGYAWRILDGKGNPAELAHD